MSHSFAAGFFWLDQLGRVADMGFAGVFRQDLIGCVLAVHLKEGEGVPRSAKECECACLDELYFT